MRYLPVEYLLIFLPMIIGVAVAATSDTVKDLKSRFAIWVGWHFYHEDWRIKK